MHLIGRIYQHKNYGGEYRYIHSDIRNIGSDLGFNDKVSSIIVYRGPSYNAGDKIRFWQHADFTGGFLDLEPGFYPDIHVHPFSFGDKISSVQFFPVTTRPLANPIRLEIHIFQHANYGGQRREILYSESRLSNQGFNDKVSSIRIFAGPVYEAGWVANFYQHASYEGGQLQPGDFGPGTMIPNLSDPPYRFNDVISSIRISQI